ncbi:MAG: hypothetical protein GXY55_00435 [Phycisphaerae bacterium]|nr:hypothetical protein [Phycisphaerae bacterium]
MAAIKYAGLVIGLAALILLAWMLAKGSRGPYDRVRSGRPQDLRLGEYATMEVVGDDGKDHGPLGGLFRFKDRSYIDGLIRVLQNAAEADRDCVGGYLLFLRDDESGVSIRFFVDAEKNQVWGDNWRSEEVCEIMRKWGIAPGTGISPPNPLFCRPYRIPPTSAPASQKGKR